MIALFAGPVARAADGDAVWLNDLDAALKQARAEKKVTIAYVRSANGPAMVKADKALADAEARPPIAHLERSFVLVRVESAGATGSVKQLLGKNGVSAPSLVALDATGEVVTVFKRLSEPNFYATWLSDLRGETFAITQSGEKRFTDPGEADLELGDVQMRFGMMPAAIARFDQARERFRKAGNAKRAEFADMYIKFGGYQLSRKDRTTRDRMLIDLMRLIGDAKYKENQADGWAAIGVIREQERDRFGAAKAYRRSLELADPNTGTAAQVRASLRALGETVIEVPVAQTGDGAPLIRVVPPPSASITGRATFVALTAPQVEKVAFFLDGAFAAAAGKKPFQVRIDVGSPPRLRTVKGIAYDRAGTVLGEASSTINDQVDVFRVAIISPVAESLNGKTTFEMDAEAPPGHRVASLDLYWNDRKVATLDQPPYRHAMNVPDGFGYLRAVATLDDGRTGEDTRTYNSSGFVAAVEVSAVNFAATVVDREGHRIPNLGAKNFIVKDEGTAVKPTVRDNPDEPITIGVAIDASASMRPLLLEMMETADRFLQTTLQKPTERAFIVAFDQQPHVIRSSTSDRAALQKAVFDIRPGGGTSLYDAIAFSLQQFHGTGGKRALVVITDAREGASQQSAETCIRMARETGVPIYVVVPPFGNMSRFGSALESITSTTGGLVMYGPKAEEQPRLFGEIRDEIRGQYLLSFVASEDAKPGVWRRLTVEVPDAAKVRTVSGYYAR